MGKYMRESKPAGGDVAVMEVSHGVCTRAKTLALQQHSSYLQLRSRRLEKPPILLTRRTRPPKPTDSSPPIMDKPKPKPKPKPNPKSSSSAAASPSLIKGAEATKEEEEEEKVVKNNNELVMLLSGDENKDDEFCVGEASFGENVLEFEPRERTTRESTPCSLIRDPDTIGTPGSTTRPTNSANANGRIHNSSLRHIPTAHDMDEFFTGAEEDQQKQFIDKYNFDPVNEKPLPGRYEWEKLDP